jgi:hypothetical protein
MPTEEDVFELYRSLRLWRNPICAACKNDSPGLCGPIGIWQVGERFTSDPYRIAFVGKTARGSFEPADPAHRSASAEAEFVDATDAADDLIGYSWAYWSYTAAIIERLFGSVDSGWERIGFTNLVKCNNSPSLDRTTATMAENCLNKLQVVWHELRLLAPRNVIFYTGTWYDNYIDNYCRDFETRDRTDGSHRVANGRKHIWWWERDCFEDGVLKCRILRTSHPQLQKKEPFVERLAAWVLADPRIPARTE